MKLHKMTCINSLCDCGYIQIAGAHESDSQARRSFLKQAGGLGALGLFGGASIQSGSAAGKGIIDTHHHFYSPSYMKAWVDYEVSKGLPHFPTQLAWTPEGAVAAMDQAGVQKSILSLASTPGVWFDFDLPKIILVLR